MNTKEKIDFMIAALQVAKDELEYSETFLAKKKKDDKFYSYNGYGYDHREPNPTLVRENLKTVGRMGSMVAGEVTLSPYCEELYKEN